ncbi:tetratricopeptide repeat protein [Caulobacter sp. 17J80-11]|uniref:tetratricopeptide repeat protein n=1 Tax=Caulobacter sp. 17J80-11 TaxID=2763502 RepID=UPI001653A5DA|nr:SEL1-like repeat protein [Caulobacter sp. 17J80-11]MBC6981506.1 sel1 repeat family protein [Caulobacter sp. 17J80-11]
MNLWSKIKPPSRDDTWNYVRAWDYTQTNSDDLWSLDPASDGIGEALDLEAEDPARAFTLLLDLAEQGSVWSMSRVGWCYRAGRGVAQDATRAEEWSRRAYEGGSTRALLDYAQMLEQRGQTEAQEAVYASGAEMDWAPASWRLALMRLRRARTRQDWLEVRALLERAAEQGSPAARWLLFKHMARGRFGLREIGRGWRMLKAWCDETLVEMERAGKA